jgi:hypothetical protein
MAVAAHGRVRRCARRFKEWAVKNVNNRCKYGHGMNPGELRLKIRCESNSRRIEYE